jgi:hypothetical protein
MVILDPCNRLKTIHDRSVPSILHGAKISTSKNIRSAIENNLPTLEETSYLLSKKCEEKSQNCNVTCDLCDEEKITEFFLEIWYELEEIWEEKDDLEQSGQYGSSILINKSDKPVFFTSQAEKVPGI